MKISNTFVKKTKTTTTPKIQIWYLLVPKWAGLIASLDYKNNNKQSTNNQPPPTTKKKQTTYIIICKNLPVQQKKIQETWGHQRAWLPKTLGTFLHFLHAPRPLLCFARRIQAVHGTLGQASLADIVGAPWAILMGSMGLEFYGKWLVNIPVTWILWKMVGIIYYFEKMSSTSGFFCFSIVQAGISRWYNKVHVEFFF